MRFSHLAYRTPWLSNSARQYSWLLHTIAEAVHCCPASQETEHYILHVADDSKITQFSSNSEVWPPLNVCVLQCGKGTLCEFHHPELGIL